MRDYLECPSSQSRTTWVAPRSSGEYTTISTVVCRQSTRGQILTSGGHGDDQRDESPVQYQKHHVWSGTVGSGSRYRRTISRSTERGRRGTSGTGYANLFCGSKHRELYSCGERPREPLVSLMMVVMLWFGGGRKVIYIASANVRGMHLREHGRGTRCLGAPWEWIRGGRVRQR